MRPPTIESPCDYVDQWEIACDFRDMIWFVSLVRCVGVRPSVLFCIPQVVTMARLLCWSAPGVGGGGVVAGLNTWRCWWFVSVLGGGGGADCWMWIGRRRHSQLTCRIDRLRRCVSVEVRMKNDGSPAWSLAFIGIPRGHVLVTRYIRINLEIPRYYVFLLSYLPSESLLHFRNMHFRWRNPFRKVFLTIRKMVRNIFLPVRMTVSGTRISVPLSPQVVRHAGST